MDIESDDSERWEDFFGSSTELAPSLLGIYDTLTSSFDTSNGNVSDSSSNHVHQETTSIHHSINYINNNNNNNHIYNKESVFAGEKNNNSEVVASAKQRTRQLNLPLADVIDDCAFSCVDSSSSICQSLSSHSRSLSDSRSSSNSSGISSSTSNQSVGSGSTCIKHRSNIRILSPNVQRIITHSDAEPVDAIDIDAIQNQQNLQLQSGVLSPQLSQRHFRKSPTPTSSTPSNGHKVKLSHIPLSKVTGKLTQSGSDLMEIFDSSSEYLDALNYVAQEKKVSRSSKFIKKPPTPAIIEIKITDDDQTPTNSIPSSPFNFDTAVGKQRKLTLLKSESPSLDSPKSMAEPDSSIPTNGEFVASTPKSTINGSTDFIEETDDFEVSEPPLKPSEIIDTFNYNLIEKLNITSKDTNSSVSLTIEAINKPLISKPLVRSSSAACASTTAVASPLLTYARSKSLTAKANTLGGPVPIKLPTAQQLEELEEARKISAESLDRLTDIKSKFSPKESRKNSVLMLQDRLKHRPLSSSSICSTSSSSSSGSDQLNGKQATSYLASVESLADQSENELMDPHSGMSVFERACMEIVDSERSYVEDLGQVIRGYLFDWKERACLSYDELRILFSNIEDIYEFNSTLLKQLINSGMDPVKIAKCFIDLQERFDVYTTYCTSYPEAISLLTKLLQATYTNALLTSTQKMLQHTLPLGSYLLKPVQRILKYHLLLDNLRKHCDVKEVMQAYEIMRQVARNIDQVKRKLEQQSRVKELSGILDGWLGPELTVLGELRQEGLLMEHNKPRMVFLFDTMLIITKSKEDNRLQFKSYIHQNNLMLSEHLPGDPTSFYVIPYDDPRNQIKLTAKNRDQKRLWAQHIKGVILAKFKNIPNRAKELVYKLGDEEDRTPDKHIWKWSLHNSSSSTPVYLERRNQCRRSEMRNRTKLKRKTVANSSSFESFIEMAEQGKEATAKPTKPLSRNNSLDESMLPALQKFAAAVRNKGKHDVTAERKEKGKSEGTKKETKSNGTKSNSNESENCELREKRVTLTSQPKSPIFAGRTLKERSKSVPRISYQLEDMEEDENSLHGSNSNLDGRKSKSSKSVEIRQYNHKTLPKRIVTLKKQRMSKRETSIFYRDLSEMDEPATTELKITESTENLLEKNDIEQAEECKEDMCLSQTTDESARERTQDMQSPVDENKKDAQIILDLLKNSKGFDKIYNKPHKKRSFDSSASTPISPEPQETKDSSAMSLKSETPPPPPPRPPSRSPPPLEFESKKDSTDENGEPIYESLLRNVHVPYKYSPVLVRNKLPVQMYCAREKKTSAPLPRPESDYVTLVYSADGSLQKVGDENVPHRCDKVYDAEVQRDSTGSTSSSSSETLKRDSQNTVINVECLNSSGNISELSVSTTEAIYARPMPKNLMKRLLSVSSTGSGNQKFSMENACNSESSLLPRARKSIDNISLPFGIRSNKPPERRVSDVSEMCRQSILHRQGSEAVGERMAHVDYADPKMLFHVNSSEVSLQRDSVFSLTSSNDSVYEHQKRSTTTSSNFEYEDDVEACLENDFRDSAIYSDDNEKRCDYETINCKKRPSSPPPLPPSVLSTRISPNYPPPQIPPKPARIPPIKSPIRSVASKAGPDNGVIVCPPHMNAAASRSWVLQQIENFNK